MPNYVAMQRLTLNIPNDQTAEITGLESFLEKCDKRNFEKFEPFPDSLGVDYDSLIEAGLIKTLDEFQKTGAPCLTCGD